MIDIEQLKTLSQDLSVLYVEDEPDIRTKVTAYLEKFFGHVSSSCDGKEGLDRYNTREFDLVISDIQMPHLNGLEMIRAIKEINPDQICMVISAYTDSDYFTEAIRLGVNGYIIKPINYTQMNRTLLESVTKLNLEKENRAYKEHLEEMVERRTREKLNLEAEKYENFDKTLQSFVKMIEDRDTYTGGHSQRVASYSRLIAYHMDFPADECTQLYRAGILHDIGKVVTPDAVLLKPGSLNELEYKLIQEHVNVGYQLLSDIPMYQEMAEIIRHHHEHYDGSGYPDGLSGDDIPVMSHIMIIADAFDAMTTNRIYKGRKSVDEALDEILRLSGKQFHPYVAKVAAKVLREVKVLDNISQTPTTDIETERFAYFYRDQVTNAYNQDYLDFILNQNFYESTYDCVNVLYLHNFNDYNQQYGWAAGDGLLNAFADYLYGRYPQSMLFRIHGDDFVIVSHRHLEIDMNQFSDLELLVNTQVSVSRKHIDLRPGDIHNLAMLEARI